MFFRWREKQTKITTGDVYERQRVNNVTERATVVWVGQDSAGIPHVRFRLSAPAVGERGDTRILAAAVFQERYRPATA